MPVTRRARRVWRARRRRFTRRARRFTATTAGRGKRFWVRSSARHPQAHKNGRTRFLALNLCNLRNLWTYLSSAFCGSPCLPAALGAVTGPGQPPRKGSPPLPDCAAKPTPQPRAPLSGSRLEKGGYKKCSFRKPVVSECFRGGFRRRTGSTRSDARRSASGPRPLRHPGRRPALDAFKPFPLQENTSRCDRKFSSEDSAYRSNKPD